MGLAQVLDCNVSSSLMLDDCRSEAQWLCEFSVIGYARMGGWRPERVVVAIYAPCHVAADSTKTIFTVYPPDSGISIALSQVQLE
jgi:hypothetical protein